MGRRDAERLPVGKRKGCHSKSQERDQYAAGKAWPRGQARRAAEVGRPAGVRPRRRRNAGAARRGCLFRGRAGRYLGLCRRRRFRTAAHAARRHLVDGIHHRPRSEGQVAAGLGEARHLRRDRRRLYGPLRCRRCGDAADRGGPVAGYRGCRRGECQPAEPPPLPWNAGGPAVAAIARRSRRSGDDDHRRCGRRSRFLALDAARRLIA